MQGNQSVQQDPVESGKQPLVDGYPRALLILEITGVTCSLLSLVWAIFVGLR